MKIPTPIPGFKGLVGATGLYALLWLALEGALWRDVLLAALILLVGFAWLAGRFLGRWTVSAGWWAALSAAAGLVMGSGLVFLTLFLMALKTGLHAHGPEYQPQEIAWLWAQLPIWAGVGALAGLGLGLLLVARSPR